MGGKDLYSQVEASPVFTRRRLLVLGLVVLSGTYVLAGGLGTPAVDSGNGETVAESKLVQPVENGSYLWPYTARDTTTSQRTLAINLIVYGDDARVKQALTEQTSLEWRLTEPRPQNQSDDGNSTVVNATENGTENESVDAAPLEIDRSIISWDDAHGATRYSYIDARPAGGEAAWHDEAFQIHAGDYFGSRYHIRAYTAPETNWTAIQIHREYWDWFRMRHTVTDIRDSRNVLELDFIEQPYVEEVSREYYGVVSGRNDGWLSEIRLAPALSAVFILGLLTRSTHRSLRQEGKRLLGWTRQNARGFVLAAVLAGLYLGIRSVGVALESTTPDMDPRVYLAVLYPLIAVGMPVLAFVFSTPFESTTHFPRLRRLARQVGPPLLALPAFGFVVAGLGAAFVLDFGGLGISNLPVQLALHRAGLASALGLIAAGATDVDERGIGLLALGVVGWLVGLWMPLFGYL